MVYPISRILFLGFFLITFSTSLAQNDRSDEEEFDPVDFQLEEGPVYEDPDFYIRELIGLIDGDLWYWSYELGYSKDQRLDIYNPNSLERKRKGPKFELKYKGERNYPWMFHFTEDSTYGIDTYTDDKQHVEKLFTYHLDKEAMKLRPSQAEEFAELPMDRKGRKYIDGAYYYCLSPDSSKFVIAGEVPVADGEEPPTPVMIWVFNKNMELDWKGAYEVDLPYEKLYWNGGVAVDNNGRVFAYYRVERNEKVFLGQNKYNYDYYLAGFYKDEEESRLVELEDPDPKFLRLGSSEMLLDDQGNIVCGGFYSNRPEFMKYKDGWKWNTAAGVFFYKFDPEDLDIMHSSFEKIDKEFILKKESEDYQEKVKEQMEDNEDRGGGYELSDYYFGDIYQYEDGGYLFTSDKAIINAYQRDPADPHRVSIFKGTHAFFKMSPEGKMEWKKKVDKYQHTIEEDEWSLSDHEYNGTMTMEKGNSRYFLYNQIGEGGSNWVRELAVHLVEVQSDGTIRKSEVLPKGKADVFPSMDYYPTRVSDNEWIIIGTQKTDYGLFKLELD